MRVALGPADLTQYREDGFCVIHDFMSPVEITEFAGAIDVTVQRLGRRRVVGNPDLDEPQGHHHDVVKQRLNLWKIDPVVRRYLLDPELGRMLCDLEGIDDIRVWHDQTFFKPPWGRPTAYHHDLPNWSFTSPHGVQLWIALDAATRENGCLYYLPGSHRQTGADRTASILGEVGALFELYPDLAEQQARPIELPAGGAIVHNGLTVHAAGANMTACWRRAMTCQYLPTSARFNGRPSILTSAQRDALSIGDPLDDDHNHPLLFTRRPARTSSRRP
jgi:hypothetical protein